MKRRRLQRHSESHTILGSRINGPINESTRPASAETSRCCYGRVEWAGVESASRGSRSREKLDRWPESLQKAIQQECLPCPFAAVAAQSTARPVMRTAHSCPWAVARVVALHAYPGLLHDERDGEKRPRVLEKNVNCVVHGYDGNVWRRRLH